MRDREPTAWAVASRAMLLVFAAGCAAAAAHRATHCCDSLAAPRAMLFAAAGLAVAIAAIFVVWRARGAVASRVLVELALLGAVLATAEIAVTAAMPDAWTDNANLRGKLRRLHVARKLDRPFDARTTSEVIAQLEAEGTEALPGLGRSWPLDPAVGGKLSPGFLPLSHVANATVVECNEGGEHLIYRTDEFGFNNPPGLVAAGRIDVAIVGESHALGHCVSPGRSTADLIRDVYPRTANFALADTRSIAQLASVREYVEPFQPGAVIWFVNVGYARATDERDQPLLTRYIEDPSFSQDLLHRQDEVDAAVRAFAVPPLLARDGELRGELSRARSRRFMQVYKLPQIRSNLNLLRRWQEPPPPTDLSVFEQSLRTALDAVSGWGGKLYVVILPDYREVVGDALEASRHLMVADAARDVGAEVIDGAALFVSIDNAVDLFALRIASHPNERGHALLAEQILAKLRE